MRISSPVTQFIIRQNGRVEDTVARTMRNLASGLRVNSAADDAAGLAISEKLRTQVNGLQQAGRNIRDGMSLLQTTDAALETTTAMLQRLRTLAVQAANDTLTAEDRELIQGEIDQLNAEIDRMERTAEWNTRKLLAGDQTQPVSDEVTSTTRLTQTYWRGATDSFDRTMSTELFNGLGYTDPVALRGASVADIGRTETMTTAPQNHINSSAIPVTTQFVTANYVSGINNYSARWKSDNSGMVAFSSSRGAGVLYAIDSAAPGDAVVVNPADYDPAGSATHVFGAGNSKTLFVSGGNIWVQTNGNPASNQQLTAGGNAATPTFSPDGLHFAYEQATGSKANIVTFTFNPALNAGRGGVVGPGVVLNTGNDRLDIDATDIVSLLPVAPEVYNVNPDSTGAPRAITVYNGAARVPYADGVVVTDGWTLQNGKEIHFTGSAMPSGADIITAYYNTDYNGIVAQNADGDGNPEYILPSTPELYNLGGPGARSLRVTLDAGASWIAYDPTHTNGFDVSGNTVTLYGASRPDAGQTVRIYWVTDGDGNPAENDYTFTLANNPELYNLNGPNPASLEVRTASGGRVAYDPTHTNGYDIVGKTVTIYGDGTAADARPDAYSASGNIINNFYHTDYNDATAVNADQDGVVEVTLSNIPELYNPNGPDPRSVRVTNDAGATWEPYDATHTNGWDLDTGTGVLSVYGTSRPDRLETMRIYYAMDYNATVSDGEVSFDLVNQPQVYNENPGDPAPHSLRVFVAGSEVGLDAVNGYTYDAGQNRITLHGTARPDALNAQVQVLMAVDLTAADAVVDDGDGNVDINLGVNPDTAYESTEVYVNNIEVPDADFTIVGANLEITGNSRPNANQNIVTQYILPVDNFVNLGGVPEDYGAGLSSEVIYLTGETIGYGVITDQRLVKGVDYQFNDADTIQLIGAARLVGLADTPGTPLNPADDTRHRITAQYVTNAQNTVTSAQPIDDTGFGAGESEIVFITGETIGYGVVNNFALTQDANPALTDYLVVGNQIILQNNARLVGDDNTVNISYFEAGSSLLALSAPVADYAPGMAGSEIVWRNRGLAGEAILTQGTDYNVAADGRSIILEPAAFTPGDLTFDVEYVSSNDFTLTLPEDFGTSAEVDPGSFTVTVDGVAVAADPVNGFSMASAIIRYDGDRPVYEYTVTLNGTARLVGDNGGDHHEVRISYDADYHPSVPLDLVLHVGANKDQTLTISVEQVNSKTLGTYGADVTTQAGAEALIGRVDGALARVGALRARYGAQLNRLEHTYNFVGLAGENMQAAESRVRDADMAAEVMQLAKSQLLSQIGRAMLAQANSNAQAVLQFLR